MCALLCSSINYCATCPCIDHPILLFTNKYFKMFELPHPEGNVKVMLLFSCISQQVKYKLLPVKTDVGFDNSNWFQRHVDDG